MLKWFSLVETFAKNEDKAVVRLILAPRVIIDSFRVYIKYYTSHLLVFYNFFGLSCGFSFFLINTLIF